VSTKNIIRVAIRAAKESSGDFKLSAVLYKGGSVLRVIGNSPKSIGYRRGLFKYEPTRHAEINALHNMPRDVLKECNMLVVRVDANGNLTSAKPCRACLMALKKAEISKVAYSNYNGEIVKINPSLIDLNKWHKEIFS